MKVPKEPIAESHKSIFEFCTPPINPPTGRNLKPAALAVGRGWNGGPVMGLQVEAGHQQPRTDPAGYEMNQTDRVLRNKGPVTRSKTETAPVAKNRFSNFTTTNRRPITGRNCGSRLCWLEVEWRSGHGSTVGGNAASSSNQGRRAARPAAVIVLRPVGVGAGAGVELHGGPRLLHGGPGLVRRRSVDDSTTTVDEAGQAAGAAQQAKSSCGSSTMVESTTPLCLDILI